jgi:hypothetical protein
MTAARAIAAALWLVAASAPAQAQIADQTANSPRGPSAPIGTSKYSESEVRALIESRGYHPVTRLRLDDSGTWHALAEQYGKTSEISVDQRGNLSITREPR